MCFIVQCLPKIIHLNINIVSMPDLSDVGAPAKGPGLPFRVPEAPPPPVRVRIEHGY